MDKAAVLKTQAKAGHVSCETHSDCVFTLKDKTSYVADGPWSDVGTVRPTDYHGELTSPCMRDKVSKADRNKLSSPCTGDLVSKADHGIYTREQVSLVSSADTPGVTCCCTGVSSTESTTYRCGACGGTYQTICRLHNHLQSYDALGSYHYDHSTRTAFPKYDTLCKETQTDQCRENDEPHGQKTSSHLYGYENIVLCSSNNAHNIVKSSHNVKNELIEISDIEVKKVVERSDETNSCTEVKVNVNDLTLANNSNVCLETDTNIEDGVNNNIIFKPFSEKTPQEHQSDGTNDDKHHPVESMDSSDPDILDNNSDEETTQDYHEIKERTRARTSSRVKRKTRAQMKCDREIIENDKTSKRHNKHNKDESESRKKFKNPYIRTTTSVQCKQCNKAFIFQAQLTKHMKEEHGVEDFYRRKKKPAQCSRCDKTFPFLVHLKKHMKEEHPVEKTYVCKKCDEKFKSVSELNEHKLSHKSTKIYKCLLCEKELSSAKTLDDHMFVHSGLKPYTCDKCGKTFRNNGQLNFHVKQYHEESPYQQCEYCGKTFVCRYRIREHIKYCLGLKPHTCDFCGKGFIRTTQLRQHRRVHTGEKPYVCDVCGLKLANLSSLQKHKRIHTGERPYTCDVCQQSFLAKTTLTDHQRIHTQDKRFTCTFCGRSFIKKWNLKTHLRQHTGETPYKCNLCGQGFKQNVLLKTHVQSHNKIATTPFMEPGHVNSSTLPLR